MANIAEFLTSLIEESGIKTIFYVPGGAIVHLISAFKKTSINLVSCYSEQGAIIAAEGYSKLLGPYGVALVTSGPGLTNTATGIASSWIDRSRVLLIAGYVQSHQIKNKKIRSFGPQEFCTKDLFELITQNNLLIDDEKKVPQIKEIIDEISNPSINDGPSIIQICLDKQATKINNQNIKALEKKSSKIILSNSEKKSLEIFYSEFEKILEKDLKIIFLLGGGCTKSENSKKLIEKLVNKNIFPIMTSWQSKDLVCHSSDSFIGLPGYFANRAANTALSECDILISLGCRLDLLQLGFMNNSIKSKIIAVDIDINELEKQEFESYLPIQVNLESVIKEILKILEKKYNLFSLKKWKEDLRSYYLETYQEKTKEVFDKRINPYKVVDLLNNFYFDVYVAGSSGGCAEISFLNYFLKKPTRFLNMPGMGSMGFGLPTVAMVDSVLFDKKIIAVIGDGGLHMNIQELAMLSGSLRNHTYIIVFNNNGYDSIRRSQKSYLGKYYNSDEKTGLKLPNLSLLSKAYNVNYLEIKELYNLETFLGENSKKGVFILEIFISENVPSGPKITPKMLEDGSIVSGSLTDLQ